MIPKLVALWRKEWSATPGTTDPAFPFGLQTLSTGDSEGAADIGSFRFAQTASYGVMPNALMQGTWLSQGYDLADPWYFCEAGVSDCPGCDTSDARYNCSSPNVGPSIHPRIKVPVGQRLAAGALVTSYGFSGPVTGPTIAGCSYTPGAATLSVAFDTALLAGGALVVQDYKGLAAFSGFSVLAGSTDEPQTGQWVAVNISLAGAAAISVDLGPLAGAAPQAIKYAWGATGSWPNDQDVTCCLPQPNKECLPAQCPLFVAQPLAPYAGLPANPFMARITAGGKCLCPAPQACDA
jgi:hypothetical protein